MKISPEKFKREFIKVFSIPDKMLIKKIKLGRYIRKI